MASNKVIGLHFSHLFIVLKPFSPILHPFLWLIFNVFLLFHLFKVFKFIWDIWAFFYGQKEK